MNFGVKKSLIVDKDLATLGYAQERREYLHADHRGVCKFASRDDPNYRTVRNAIVSTLENLRARHELSKRRLSTAQRKQLATFLGVSDLPEDDFVAADNLRMSGSCEWLIGKSTFQTWLHGTHTHIFAITAKPATGKTILSGKVVAHLRGLGKRCSFYFFKYGNKDKSGVASFLLSMAFQMACSDEQVFAACLELYETEDQLSKIDWRTIWRKLFLDCILKIEFEQEHYWIIDALDECRSEADLIDPLTKLVEACSVRIFLTSRNIFEPRQKLGVRTTKVHSEEILEQNSKSDIALYLKANMDELPLIDDNGRHHIVSQILEKSRGCFLWVSLVFQELRNVNTASDVQQILDEVPTDMNDLFARILDWMSAASHGKSLAKAILTWTVCATRALRSEELHEALKIDLRDSIGSIETSIRSSCGHLVYIDAQKQVLMIHLTARDFLLRASPDSEFGIVERDGHRRLLLTCLRYLNRNDIKGVKGRNKDTLGASTEHFAFASYACGSLCDHLSHLSWTDEDVLTSLAQFFDSPYVLSWIEFIAKHSDLHRLIQTGKALGSFLQGSFECSTAYQKEITLLNSWATDLVRVVMKFGIDLKAYPYSIYNLIPPFCPPETAPRKQFGSAGRSITVRGLRALNWDDCLSTIVDTAEQYSTLASSQTHFAIGCFSGKISLLEQSTFQEVVSFEHGEPVRILSFGERGDLLVSAGSKSLRVWDVISKAQMCRFDTRQPCMALSLVNTDDDLQLLGAMKDHQLKIWSVRDELMIEDLDWTRGLEEMTSRLYRRPITAAFSVEASLLAIIYKGQDILLWDLESDAIFDIYSRESGAYGNPGRSYGSSGVRCLVFGNGPSAQLLAAAYTDGELILFDSSTGEIKKRLVTFSHMLASSPDGSILASADPSGTIQLFNFETMGLLYRLHAVEPGIQGLSFSEDGLRILDVRGSRCRVWGPTVLMSKDGHEESRTSSSGSATPTTVQEAHDADVAITSLACHDSEDVFFCGKEDGSVYLYDIDTGFSLRTLFSHAHDVAIVYLHFEEESRTLTSVDLCSRIMVHKLHNQQHDIVATAVLFDHRAETAVGQLTCQKSLQRILVSSAQSDTLWSISGEEKKEVVTMSYESRGPYQWANHPMNATQLILISNNEAHIHDWHTLKRLTGVEGILLQGSILPELSVCSIIPCFGGEILATVYSESNRPQAKSRLVLWKASDFVLEAQAIVPVPHYQEISSKVDVLIGVTGTDNDQTERLIFLHSSNWVCSVNSESTKTADFVRHFFFPADWLSTNTNLIMEVSKALGDSFLVWDTLAIRYVSQLNAQA